MKGGCEEKDSNVVSGSYQETSQETEEEAEQRDPAIGSLQESLETVVGVRLTEPAHLAEAGHQKGWSPGEDGAELTGPGVTTAEGERAQYCAAEPAGPVLVSEVYRQVGRANVQQVEQAEVDSNAAGAEDVETAHLSSSRVIPHRCSVLDGPAGADQEGEEGEEEDVVGQDEYRTDHESQESSAGGETLTVTC